MNYRQALKRQADGRWDYTSTNNGRSHAIGYCAGPPNMASFERLGIHVPESDRQKWEEHAAKFHTDGHATEEEACECYRQYILDQRCRETHHPDEQRKCEICATWTDGGFIVGGYHIHELCQEHRNRESLDKVFPGVGYSFES